MQVTASAATQLSWHPSVRLLSADNEVYSTRSFIDLLQPVWLLERPSPVHRFPIKPKDQHPIFENGQTQYFATHPIFLLSIFKKHYYQVVQKVRALFAREMKRYIRTQVGIFNQLCIDRFVQWLSPIFWEDLKFPAQKVFALFGQNTEAGSVLCVLFHWSFCHL